MGPGRWGSRGDIKLGVNVTYADINNTAMLLEVARLKGQSTPDLSFGTHFFQDLVEARIRYLPLYPDEPGNVFNEEFLLGSESVFASLVPEFAHLADTIRVIDVPVATDGHVLRVLLNADLDQALAMLADPRPAARSRQAARATPAAPVSGRLRRRDLRNSRWRRVMADRIAALLDPERFGVVALYVLGSTKTQTAAAGSDIDLLVHLRGGSAQRRALESWLEGWSICLDEVNYLRTGLRSGGLLDVYYVTDEEVEAGEGVAAKIGAVTDAAAPLSIGCALSQG